MTKEEYLEVYRHSLAHVLAKAVIACAEEKASSDGKNADDEKGKMQVVSGAIGHEKIHYEAPGADIVPREMNRLIEYINNESDTDLVIKAGIVQNIHHRPAAACFWVHGSHDHLAPS